MSAFVQIGYGRTAGGATSNIVTTGVGDTGFTSNVTAGNYLDVLFMSQSGAGSYSCAISSSGTASLGTPVQIDYLNDLSADNREFYRFLVPITGSGTCAVIATYGQSYQTVNVAAAEISGLSTTTPFNTGNAVHGATNGPTGSTNSSGSTPALTVQPAILTAWSVIWGLNGAVPSAGTGFTVNGTAGWAGGGSTPYCNYETAPITSLAAVAATSTAVANYSSTWMFGAVFNNVASAPVTAALTGTSGTFALGGLGVTNTGSGLISLGRSICAGPGISPDYNKLFTPTRLSNFTVMSPNVTLALGGLAGAFTPGALYSAYTSTLGGVAATSSVGTIAVLPNGSFSLVGVQATFAQGAFSSGVTLPLSGQLEVSSTGSLTVAGSSNVTVALQGQAGSFGTGALTATMQGGALNLMGQTLSAQLGILSIVQPNNLIGSSAIFSTGVLTAQMSYPPVYFFAVMPALVLENGTAGFTPQDGS